MYKTKINGITWKIIPTEAGNAIFEEKDGESVLGITMFGRSEIYVVTDDVSDDILYRTLKHEFTHAFLFSCGIDAENMTEEDICNFIESYGEEIIKKAKSLYRRILKDRA